MTRLLLSLLVGVTVLASVKCQRPLVAEVYFVAEPQVIRNYMKQGYTQNQAVANLKADADYFIHEVNEYYKSISQYGINIEIRSKAFDILTNQEIYGDCRIVDRNLLQKDFGIAVFKEWLVSQRSHDKHKYDLAILWHGYDKFSTGDQTGTAGYAFVGSACDGLYGIGLVEYTMTHETAITTAHEIAHILGARHDDIPMPGVNCHPEAGHIMSPSADANNPNRWTFSECTARHIIKSSRQNKTCLRETTAPPSSFKMADMKGSDLLNLDNICRRQSYRRRPVVNPMDMYFCQHPFFYGNQEPKGDAVCQAIHCGLSPGERCGPSFPTEGIVCDVNKRCKRGKCVAAPFDLPTQRGLKSNCLYGNKNHGEVEGNKVTCAAYLKQYSPQQCAQTWVRNTCCKDCENVKITPVDPNCPSGDRNPRCPTVPNVCSNPTNRQVCCKTCANYISKRNVDSSRVVTLSDNFWLMLWYFFFGKPSYYSPHYDNNGGYPMSN